MQAEEARQSKPASGNSHADGGRWLAMIGGMRYQSEWPRKQREHNERHKQVSTPDFTRAERAGLHDMNDSPKTHMRERACL
jgi:hypothetical protein